MFSLCTNSRLAFVIPTAMVCNINICAYLINTSELYTPEEDVVLAGILRF